jgi:large subunit ribosomal protein L18
MSEFTDKLINLKLRKLRVRSRVIGTSERPRLSVRISNRHVSAQLIDDSRSHTIASSSTSVMNLTGSMTEKAQVIGTDIAKKAKKAKISKAVFDRNGRLYAKRLSALADAARKEGLEF